VVEAESRTRIHRGRLAADLSALDPVTPQPAAHLDLLPAHRCPRAGLLERLARLTEQVTIDPLAHFLDLALGREELFDFLAAPASVGYHHGYPGGLLEHSLEVAEALAAMAHPSGQERELAIVGGLFHDLGKIRSFDEKLRITLLGRLIGHEALTLELLAQPLAELDWLWAEGAAALRAVWSAQKTGLARRLSIATAVQGADWVSAARGNEARAFGRGQGGWARSNHQGYWRPRLPEGLEPA
jgi:3'-5' exoribonuclease